MKNAWNVAVAACVSGAIGYFVGLQMHSGRGDESCGSHACSESLMLWPIGRRFGR